MFTQQPGPTPYPAPLRIFFDLSGHERWFTHNLQELVEVMRRSSSPDAVLVNLRGQADCVLHINGCPSLMDKLSDCFKWPKKMSPPAFVWEMGDLPTGGLPGLYVSLPAYMYDQRRHRAFCLPIVMNEMIRPFALDDARFLFGYFGSTSSGLRARINPVLRPYHDRKEALIEVRDPIWDRMFDRSGLEAKAAYADNLRQCRFNLCPRGCVLAGAGSRLYETMQAARVPVIISDWITLPEGVDWDGCSVRISERDIARIPQILNSYSERWPEMALNARRAYEEHFSREATLGELGRQLRALLMWHANETFATRIVGFGRIALGQLFFQPRQYYANLKRLVAYFAKPSKSA